jgi:UDP-N-acetylmuramate--alanine ligase
MTRLLDPADSRPIHFVGIAGAGMSALAELFTLRGVGVTGCDAHPENAPDLAARGIAVQTGHSPDHVATARALVVTSAMPKDHPELVRARELGLPVVRRAEALGEATAGTTLIGVAGTHGKSTTTVMTTEALAAGGLDPTGYVGARVTSWGGNLRPGSAQRFVVEADEYDRSFLALSPTMAVVTNLEADHLDIYADLTDIKGAFAQFVRGARNIVLCGDDAGANSLKTPSSTEVVRYGFDDADARLVARDVQSGSGKSAFDVVFDEEMLGRVELKVPGRHNVLNSLAAIASGLALGADFKAMARGLANFAGAERRFQRLGDSNGILVVDDYAHHPTEIAATLAAARAAYPDHRIVAAFQPHLYSRTRDFAGDFGGALATADTIYLTEIYGAREKPISGVTAALIDGAARDAGRAVTWRGERAALAAALAAGTEPGDVVLTLGAGDITRTGPELLALLSAAQ